MSTVSTVCFSVDGTWLADFARTRLEEGSWDRALTMLTESLEGLSTDQALAILKGEATLIGNSNDTEGIEYKVLSKSGKLAKRMQDRLQYMYGDLFRLGDEIWQPYAMVSGWCKDDWDFARTFTGSYKFYGVTDDNKQLGAFRSLYYAIDPHRDMLVRIKERAVGEHAITSDVLCKRFIGSVPFWHKVSTNDPVNFIEELLTKKSLDLRGAFRNEFGDRYNKRDVVAETDKLDIPEVTERARRATKDAEKKQAGADVLKAVEEFFSDDGYDLKQLRELGKVFERAVDTLHTIFTAQQWDEIDKLRDLIDTREEALMRELIIAQAKEKGGFIQLKLKNGQVLDVPKHPFVWWCFRGAWRSNTIDFEAHGNGNPEWNFISRSGMKMIGDDPAHTDWVIGAGISLKDVYERGDGSIGDMMNSAAYEIKHALVTEYTGHKFTTLTRNKKLSTITGEVVKPNPNERVQPGSIAIVPHAGPEYQTAMETACMESADGGRGCIICEVGGKLAHLAIVGREFGCTVLMLPDALKMYKDGEKITIDLDAGTMENYVI